MAQTVLVVEDEEPVRIMLGRLLRSQGYNVMLAANALEARTVLARIRPDIVVSDIIMPGENGIELRRAISGLFPDLPVVLISGFSEDGPAEFAARTPHTYFLPKPFAAEAFLNSVLRAAPHVEEVEPSASSAPRDGLD